jgi:long-chain acyl-CoA synthetase
MNLLSVLKETVRLCGDHSAYVFQGEKTSYKEYFELVTEFASGLNQMGVKKGDHVALVLGNSPEFMIGLYGALKAGATVIPINPNFTPDEITYIIQNGDVKAIICLDSLVPLLKKIEQNLSFVNSIIVCPTSEERLSVCSFELKMKTFLDVLDAGLNESPAISINDDDTAVILYTSGTTGKPKGAMLTHYNLYSNASDVASFLQYSKNDKVIACLPMFHVFCLTVVINASIVCGSTILISTKFNPQEVFQVSNQYGATVFAGVPTMYNFLLHFEKGNPLDFKNMRLCVSGGASMPVSLLEKFEEKFNVKISEGYGLSEASPVTCFNPLHRPRKAGSIGTTIMNVESKVVNKFGEEVPVGEIGELIIKGPNVMKGYYKMPDETKIAIRGGWLYTGDLARMDNEGYFYIVDRIKDLIIVGGYNVYPREVEEVLYKHSDIVEAVVIGEHDETFGEVVKAFVVAKKSNLSQEELLMYCKEHLVKYKIPKSIEFLEELPKNSTGKIVRRVLRQPIISRNN